MASTNFLITSISVSYTGDGNPFAPLVYKTNVNNSSIVWGCAPSIDMPLEDPVRITESSNSGNSYLQVATGVGQYQIFLTSGSEGTNPYYIMIQSMLSPQPSPLNQKNLWNGTDSSVNFTLNINLDDTGAFSGISLTEDTSSAKAVNAESLAHATN